MYFGKDNKNLKLINIILNWVDSIISKYMFYYDTRGWASLMCNLILNVRYLNR